MVKGDMRMVIESKVLNTTNTAYGSKTSKSAWKQRLGRALGPFWSGDFKKRGIKDLYDAGKFHQAVGEAEDFLQDIKSVQDLEKMGEAELAVFYYLGMSYAQIGEIEKAISCLHIVLSQNRFVSSLMIGFAQFIDMAHRELRRLAEEHGEDLVEHNDPAAFLQHKGK